MHNNKCIKKYRIAILFIILITGCLKLLAQHAVVVGHSQYAINYRAHQGYIILNNGEKIDGLFQYAMDEFPTYNLKLVAANNKVIKRYSVKKIISVVLAGADKTLSNNDSTYFYTLGRHKVFYRQLTFGDVKIYDERFFNVNEGFGLVYPMLTIFYKGNEYTARTQKELEKLLVSFGIDNIFLKNSISVAEMIKRLNALSK